MINIIDNGVYLVRGKDIIDSKGVSEISDLNSRLQSEGKKPLNQSGVSLEESCKNTISYNILTAHNVSGNPKNLKIKFDAMASHDITYVGIVQTARASGLKQFPIPYVLTNCHNSLCAVGGTINEDDHVFGLSAAKKYGGIFVPAHQAVIHQYMREMAAGCGKMILGSDSHTRYGAFGTMAVGEGGPELVKQLLNRTYDIKYPDIIAVYLEGTPKPGVGPQDIALALIGAVFSKGIVKNKVLEFVGPGIDNLSMEYRCGIDVMTTETTCLSSVWCTDEKVNECLKIYGRESEYKVLEPGEAAYYDGLIHIDLSKVEPMIALPFHPSNVYTIEEMNKNAADILRKVELEAVDFKGFTLTNKIKDGRLKVDQGVVGGCAGGTFENINLVADILKGKSLGNDEFALSIYPASQPVNYELLESGAITKLVNAGATIRTAFCGPCFGAGDVPSNNSISIRHVTRNFPNREGSKPANGQIASVALMDARSIAATALNGGLLTAATEISVPETREISGFNKEIYNNRVYNGYGNPKLELDLKFGPNIADWPKMSSIPENILLKVASVINDPVTTTDELIPSGETSSYRSNPYKLAEFTLSRKDPEYVGRAKSIQEYEALRQDNGTQNIINKLSENKDGQNILEILKNIAGNESKVPELYANTGMGSVVFANRPGDGSAREQAASCQKVLGGWANIAVEYATKRYRSNLINWGIVPFTVNNPADLSLENEGFIFVKGIKAALKNGSETVEAVIFDSKGRREALLKLENLSEDERDIILSGCLINYYSK